MTPPGHRSRRRKLTRLLAAPLAVLALAACESLLEVDIPGSVTADALNDPQLALTLVNSVQGDFECGFVDYMRFPGQWFEEFQNASQSRPDALAGLRSNQVYVYADPCDSGTGPLWGPMQLPRQQAKRAIELITGFDSLDVPDWRFYVAKSRLYEGYSIQLLAEQFCGVTLDGGPLLTPANAYDSAIVKFTDAIGQANAAIADSRQVTQSTAVRNAALVGRARARMYAGDVANALTDAGAVPSGFQFLSTYDSNPGRRRNRIFEIANVGRSMMPHRQYSDLTLNATTGLHEQATAGVADPRVPISYGPDTDPRGFTPMRRQLKYWGSSSSVGYAADIPFATWREARLMIAEMDLAQALTEINNLRTSTTGLPAGISAAAWPLPTISAATWGALTPAEQMDVVREERRRELWMQGVQAGDKQRWNYPAWEAQDEYGQALSPGGCMPIPLLEQTSNPNL